MSVPVIPGVVGCHGYVGAGQVAYVFLSGLITCMCNARATCIDQPLVSGNSIAMSFAIALVHIGS